MAGLCQADSEMANSFDQRIKTLPKKRSSRTVLGGFGFGTTLRSKNTWFNIHGSPDLREWRKNREQLR